MPKHRISPGRKEQARALPFRSSQAGRGDRQQWMTSVLWEGLTCHSFLGANRRLQKEVIHDLGSWRIRSQGWRWRGALLEANRTARQRHGEVRACGMVSHGAVWQSKSQECRPLEAISQVATWQQIPRDKLTVPCPDHRRAGYTLEVLGTELPTAGLHWPSHLY